MRERDRGAGQSQQYSPSSRRQIAPGKRTVTERLSPRRGSPSSSVGAREGAPARAADWEASPDLLHALGIFSSEEEGEKAAGGDGAARAEAASAQTSAVAPAGPSAAGASGGPVSSAAPSAPVAARPEDRYPGPQPASTYFAVHRAKILHAISARLAAAAPPPPHARLKWLATGAALAGAFEAALFDAEGGIFNLAGKMPALLYPTDPWRVIDSHRELTSGAPGELSEERPAEGSLEWNPVVGAALALEVEAQLRSSSARMGVRYVAQAEAGSGQVTVPMLVTSHPFDRITARLLCSPGVVALGGARTSSGRGAARPDTDAPGAFKEGLRLVSFEWLGARDPALWNWVRVVEPIDARREEVAMAVLDRQDGELHTELAYGLTGSPPFFQIPPRWARDLEGARRHAPHQSAQLVAAGGGADEAAAQHSALPLAESPLTDEAAQLQAQRAQRADAGVRAAVEAPEARALAAQLDRSAAQLHLVLEGLGPWHLYSLVGPALRWVARHREAIYGASDEVLRRWAPIIEQQQALLFEATGELTELLHRSAHLEAEPTAPAARPTRQVLAAYAIAMGESHLVESAAVQLASARRLSAELPLRMIELSLRESRGAAREAVEADAEARADRANPKGGAAPAPLDPAAKAAREAADPRMASQRGMEWSALSLREAAVIGQPSASSNERVLDPHALEALAVGAAESAHRARVAALEQRLLTLQGQVERAGEGAIAGLANLFHGDLRRVPALLARVQHAVRRSVATMDQRTQAWMAEHAASAAGGDAAASRRFSEGLVAERRASLKEAQRELSELAERERLQELFQRAIDTIKDAALYTLIFETALLIGVSVVGAFAGAAVGGLVRGAMLADAAVESAAFYRGAMLARGAGAVANVATDAAVNALGQTALGDAGERAARAFAVNLLTSAAVVSALRPLHGAAKDWAILEDKTRKLWTVAGGKRVLAHGAVLTAEMITGAAVGFAVERLVPAARAGKPVGEEDASSWLIQGAAMGVGRFIAGRLGQLQERLAATMEGAVHLRKRAAVQAHLASQVEASGDALAALRLLDEHQRLLQDEAELITGLRGEGAGAGARGALDAKQLGALEAGNAAARVELESSSVAALRLHFAGLEPLSSSGTAWSGTRAQIEAALEATGAAAGNLHHDPLRRRWTFELAGKRISLSEVDQGLRARQEEPAASQRATGEMAALDPHAAELARIRNGPPGKIREEAELSNADVAMSMNAQLRSITVDDVHGILSRYPEAQREQARYVLSRSSQFGNMEAWNTLRLALEPYLAQGYTLYRPGSGSLADNLTYTAAKHSYAKLPDVSLILTTTTFIGPRTVVLLDEVVLHQLRADPRLAEKMLTSKCQLLEPRGFQAGINLYNNPTPEAVATRTDAIFRQALALSADGSQSFEQAVDAALHSGTRAQLDAVNPALAGLVKEVDVADHPELSDASITRQLNGDAGINEEQLSVALARVPPELHDHAREVMARQSEIFSSRRFASDLGDQHHKLLARAAERGVPEDKVFFYIPQGGKSYGMIAMAHRQATGTSVDRYINGLDDLRSRKLGSDTALVIFDDVAGSGHSLRDASRALGNIGYAGSVLVSPMISTEMANDVFNNPEDGVSADYRNIEYMPRTMSRALEESFFLQSLKAKDRHLTKKVVRHRGYKNNALSVAFPYMAPDNNNALFGDLIAKFYMTNQNVLASKAYPYEFDSRSGDDNE